MPGPPFIADMASTMLKRAFPTITLWNRLEGRPRTEKFDRALKAEVRDALWMLTRQWQFGEFRGDDAGSPVFAKIHLAETRLKKYRADGHAVEEFDERVPLEAEVERRPLRFEQAGREVSLDLRLLMGRQWIKLIGTDNAIKTFAPKFVEQYPVHSPDPTKIEDAPYCAHPEAWGAFAATSGRRMDGFKLYDHLVSDPLTHHAHDGIAGLDAHEVALNKLAERFVEWFERLFYQPPATGEDAWEPSRLEYRFECSAPEQANEKVLTAEEYYHGHLDWYNLDIDPVAQTLGDPVAPAPDLPHPETRTLFPAPITFEGMPHTRWWAFEEGRTNFGDVKPDTTDIAKLLLVEFGLVYANDWFMIPYTMPSGSIARVRGLAVTNVFGERTWVEAAGRGLDDDWQRWAMFQLNTKGKGNEAADTSLLLLPTASNVQEGPTGEEVLLIRDEVANMVWGVERTITLPSGASKPGGEAARETLHFFVMDLERRLGGPPPASGLTPTAEIRYQVMNTVPEHWIPFIPVHVPGDVRETQLQRATLPRILEGDSEKPGKVRPRTMLMREGLDQSVPAAYFIHEEEVPRAGVRVTQSFQRTRWRGGEVFVWLGVRKQTGRGEGASQLAFDRILDVSG